MAGIVEIERIRWSSRYSMPVMMDVHSVTCSRSQTSIRFCMKLTVFVYYRPGSDKSVTRTVVLFLPQSLLSLCVDLVWFGVMRVFAYVRVCGVCVCVRVCVCVFIRRL